MFTEIKFFDTPLPSPAPPAAMRGPAGAWAEFHGLVRATEQGKEISGIAYEIYEPMARKVLTAHIDALAQKHGLLAACFWHRSGAVPVGEAAVYAAVAAPHRKEAFAALAELMDRLKTDVPIWKAEVLPA
jgi:molybdopterin synthase catalytic subunit